MRTHGREQYPRNFSGDRMESTIAIGFATLTLVYGLGGGGKLAEQTFDADDAVRVVEDAGYENASVNDQDILLVGIRGCDRTDVQSYEVSATSATTEREVSLLVCDGLFKQATIRTN